MTAPRQLCSKAYASLASAVGIVAMEHADESGRRRAKTRLLEVVGADLRRSRVNPIVSSALEQFRHAGSPARARNAGPDRHGSRRAGIGHRLTSMPASVADSAREKLSDRCKKCVDSDTR